MANTHDFEGGSGFLPSPVPSPRNRKEAADHEKSKYQQIAKKISTRFLENKRDRGGGYHGSKMI
jgi:hypothetical protein